MLSNIEEFCVNANMRFAEKLLPHGHAMWAFSHAPSPEQFLSTSNILSHHMPPGAGPQLLVLLLPPQRLRGLEKPVGGAPLRHGVRHTHCLRIEAFLLRSVIVSRHFYSAMRSVCVPHSDCRTMSSSIQRVHIFVVKAIL